ncbi:MAG: Glu-tRNA(Gln) amidotransferase subunit GatD [Candidatus Nanoarchaeia archaeon]
MKTHNVTPRSRVHITTKTTSYEGIVLPSRVDDNQDIVVLKLDSGYNVGILQKNITKVQEIASTSSTSPEKQHKNISQNTSLPTIALLHTGGTIASKVDYSTGGVIADFKPEAILELFPELSSIANIQSTFLGNMFSDDFRLAHFNTIAKHVLLAARKGIKKCIVTCGTDFLHYNAAALSFLLHDLPISVLVVGSQRSSDRGSSDAAMNLICAAQFLATTDFCGVGICMHENTDDNTCSILRGVNARKMHSSRRDAFKQINARPYACVSFEKKTVTLLDTIPTYSSLQKSQTLKDLPLPDDFMYFNENLKLGLLYSHPQMWAQEIKAYEGFDGLVIAGSGLGHLPITKNDDNTKEHEKISQAIQLLAKTMPVAMSTQTIYGRVHLNVYSPARKLHSFGVLGHQSAMTPETTFVKLAWLLSTTEPDSISEKFNKNIVGEHDAISQKDFY